MIPKLSQIVANFTLNRAKLVQNRRQRLQILQNVLAAGAYDTFIRAAAQHAPAWASYPIRGQIPKLAF